MIRGILQLKNKLPNNRYHIKLTLYIVYIIPYIRFYLELYHSIPALSKCRNALSSVYLLLAITKFQWCGNSEFKNQSTIMYSYACCNIGIIAFYTYLCIDERKRRPINRDLVIFQVT